MAKTSKVDWDDVRWEFRHMLWTYIPAKHEGMSNVDIVEITDQYGGWYHVSLSRDAAKLHPDAAYKLLRTLDKIRMGLPVQVKFNSVDGVFHGKYKH